jgi:tetratricopeptide (TPR) repeat protein
LYSAVIAAAVAVSRAIAVPAGPANGGALLLWGTVAAAAAAIPLAVTPSRADVLSKAATRFESLGRWPEAVAAYREATRLQPREAYYDAGLGRALLQDAVRLEPPMRSARLREAREAFERARLLMPSDPDHTRHLGSLARVEASTRVEDRDTPLADADRLYADATARWPGLTALWVDWGWIDADRGRFPQALEKVNHARALDPDRVDAFVLRAYVRAAQSDLSGALADYDAALARDAGNADALRGRAAVLAAR